MIHRSCRVICESRFSASILSRQLGTLSAQTRAFRLSQGLYNDRAPLNFVHASGTVANSAQCRALFQAQTGRLPRRPQDCRSCRQKRLHVVTQARPASSEAAMAVGSVVKGLQPAVLWKYFEEITKIPRPSKFEERILQYLKDFAAQHGLKWKQDEVGNLVIYRPGSGGGEDALPVIIQGHVDMVTEKDSDVDHDFMKDPLRLHITHDGKWLKATGTTLGADNGVGVAAALALLVQGPDVKLPPLECLFTVDEETGLTGAFRLDASLLRGRTMLNLDTEDWGELFIGCAGGGDTLLTLPVELEPAPAKGFNALELHVSGLMGGHSGLNIHEGRGNAVQLAARTVDRILHVVPGARLVSIQGGDKRNAIAREATAELVVPREAASEARLTVENVAHALKEEYGALEKELQVSLPGSARDGHVPAVLSRESENKLLTLLRVLPHGVIKFSHHVPGLVETSTNLASVKFGKVTEKEAEYVIQCNTRSSLMDALESTREVIRRTATMCGAEVELDIAYPGWNPNPKSKVLELAKQVVSDILGSSPKVGAIHAGLECGIIGEKLPGVDTVSLGPTIRGAHSPDEKVEIATVAPFWTAVLGILAHLADVKDSDSD